MAVTDMFLKIEGIEGESKDSKHGKEIDVLSWSWGASNTAAGHEGGGHGAGKVAMQDFSFSMHLNKASTKLLEHCATGKHIKKAILTCRKAGGKAPLEFLKYTMTDIVVSSYQTGGSGGGDIVPVESISLNFAEVKIEYDEQKQDGTGVGAISFSYNLKTNKAGA
jgi:type VI secretion system secreted protein Hcp